MLKAALKDYPSYFQRYIDLVPDDNELIAGFYIQRPIIVDFLESITEEKSNYAYAPDKWTLKDMLQHMTDTERIFGYRALCFARREKISLPGFEESEYAANVNTGERSWQNLLEEFFAVRYTSELLFKSFSAAVLKRTGIANNNVTSVGSLGFITLGHVYHHKKIIEERYL